MLTHRRTCDYLVSYFFRAHGTRLPYVEWIEDCGDAAEARARFTESMRADGYRDDSWGIHRIEACPVEEIA